MRNILILILFLFTLTASAQVVQVEIDTVNVALRGTYEWTFENPENWKFQKVRMRFYTVTERTYLNQVLEYETECDTIWLFTRYSEPFKRKEDE